MLLDAHDSAAVRADLEAVEQDLAQRRLGSAREHLARGSLQLARRELSAVLLLDPRCVETYFLIAEVDRVEAREDERQQAFCAAVDDRRWEQALWRLAGDDPAPWQSCQGRAVDLMGRAWTDLEREFLTHVYDSDLRAVETIVTRGAALEAAFPEVLAVCGVDCEALMAGWQSAVSARRAVRRLIREALVHTRRLESRLAYQKMREASLTIPDDPQLRARTEQHRERLVRQLLARLDSTTRARDWGAALAITEDLDEIGWRPTAERPLSLAEMRRRHTEELLAEADQFERRGLPGNALLATLEASAACDYPADLLARAARLRETVSSIPLVVLATEPGADLARTGSTVVVRAGPPQYSEQRTVLLKQIEGVVTRTREQWRDNPVYTAEQRRRARAAERVADLRQKWQRADPIGRAHAERRYRAAVADLERTRQRIRAVPERRRHSIWEAERVAVEIHEVQARLERPVVIEARDGARREERIVCEERVTDRHIPADPRRGQPEDPAELPEAKQIERRLVLESEEKLAELVTRLRRDERRTLVDRVEEALEAGRVAEGVELAVRALMVHSADRDGSTSHRLRRLLSRWTERAPRTVDALVRQ